MSTHSFTDLGSRATVSPRHQQSRQQMPARYWNPELLHAFTLHMAGHGLCVSESMMLGDAAYARANLRHACAMDDQTLQQLAMEMLCTLGHDTDPEALPRGWAH